MAQGIQLRLTHTGITASNILVDDIRTETTGGRRGLAPEYIYVPAPTTQVPNPQITLTFGGLVPMSFERGDIRGYINGGYLTAEFLVGDQVVTALEGIMTVVATAGAPSPDPVTGTSGDLLYMVDSTADRVNITLVAGADHATGHFRVVDLGGNAATNPITVTAAAGETINGGASYALNLDNGAAEFVWDLTSNWFSPVTVWAEVPPIEDLTELVAPAGADLLVIEDSAAGFAKKKLRIANLPAGGNPTIAPAAAPGPYLASAEELVEADASGGPFTVNLPAAPATGDRVIINKIDGTGNVVTVNGNGANINGAGTFPITVQYASVTVIRGTTQWWIT